MEHNVYARKGLFQLSWRAYVASDDLNLLGKIIGRTSRMHLGCEIVQHADIMTRAKQSIR
jgi:hypothetical protein